MRRWLVSCRWRTRASLPAARGTDATPVPASGLGRRGALFYNRGMIGTE